jgi:hypothetical protein
MPPAPFRAGGCRGCATRVMFVPVRFYLTSSRVIFSSVEHSKQLKLKTEKQPSLGTKQCKQPRNTSIKSNFSKLSFHLRTTPSQAVFQRKV